ncbi:peroxisomal membrane protein PEX13-like [Cydia splendana]|uniref:peroxisomal membrane protein PEX13-like n=1 Tax=Cydia splendana TaxID=1100963 RepID=UPI00300C7D73
MEKCSHRIHSPVSSRQHTMAAKLIVVATALALCQATPALYNGRLGFLYRDGRNFAISKAYSNNLGNQASGEASARDGSAQAYGSASGNQLTRADLVYPSQASAQAELYNAPAIPVYGSAKAVAEAQNGGAIFYAPATNRATADAQSNGGYGSASSTANNAQGSAISSAKTQGYIGSAASDAAVNTGYDNAISATKVAPAPQKRIHWRFGTLYGTPSHINTRAQADANGFNAAKSTADVHQAGSAHSAANTYGSDGSANANANVNGGYGSANRDANTYGSGFAKSAANTQGSGYGSAQSQANTHGAGFGAAKSSANTGYGSANANADVNGGAGFAKSAANNGYGSAVSSANTNGFGSARSDTNTHGFGSAHANARVN